MEKRKNLRQRSVDKEKEKAKRIKTLNTSLLKILKKAEDDLTTSDKELLEDHDEIVQELRSKIHSREERKDRIKECEDDLETLRKKCAKLADAISKSKRLVVYTGAGISTSANIPDYRGPNGVWTLLDQGKEIAACDLGLAQPTTAHMALYMLYRQGRVSHIVSQNCDGLHLRSGIPRNKLSEVHGNMFIEVCKTCKPVRPYVRLFDVTERTNRFRHWTRRRCYICGSGLMDTIVHFGERGSIAWPINWNGASRAAEKADMILCLGSSLKVLRRYPWLWCMDRPLKQRPPLYIVNLQWTPKDSAATMKLNGRCDFVMSEVLKNLRMRIPEYTPYNDPLLSYSTHLNEKEEHTTTRRTLIESRPVGVSHISMEAKVSDSGVIKEVRCETRFTTANSHFGSAVRNSRKSSSASSNHSSSGSSGSSSSSSSSSSGSSSSSSSSSGSSSNSSSNSNSNSSSAASSNAASRNSSTDRCLVLGEEERLPKKCKTANSDPVEHNIKQTIMKLETEESQPDCDTDIKPIFSLLEGKSPCNLSPTPLRPPSPFPSPDHTYAISPLKAEYNTEELPKFLQLVEEIKVEPKVLRSTSRYGLREKRNQKYKQFDEEYFIMCQEEILEDLKKDENGEPIHENGKKKREEQELVTKKKKKKDTAQDKDGGEKRSKKKVVEVEYRTVEWPKDALYFSYEPNFLFLESDSEEGYVCECCDPANKKKGTSSSEDNSEVEHEDIQEGEEEESSPEGEVSSNEEPKPMAPGWFGKGRTKGRKRGRTK